MIKIDNLKIGKRYWLDECKDISGVFRGRFNSKYGLDYNRFDSIIKTEAYDDSYFEVNGIIEFTCMESSIFPEYKVTFEQLELTF